MFLKANISARTADASEWWRVRIQNEVIKTEHAQNSLWYLNSCWWNPVQELHWVTIQIIIPQAFHNTSHQQSYHRNTQHSGASCYHCLHHVWETRRPTETGQSQNSDFMFHRQLLSWEKENCYICYGQLLVWGQLSGSGGLNISVPPARISFPWEFGPMRSGSGSLWLLLNQFRAPSESGGNSPNSWHMVGQKAV